MALLGPPWRGEPPSRAPGAESPHERLCARLGAGPCFFDDLLIAAGQTSAEDVQEALWDLVWTGVATNDAFAPLRAPRLKLAPGTAAGARRGAPAGRFSARRRATGALRHPPGRWSLTASLFDGPAAADPGARRRAHAELLLERHGILTRELVLAEGVPGGFAALYPELAKLETLGVARRGYFVEGLGGAQFALAGAVERLRAQRPAREGDASPGPGAGARAGRVGVDAGTGGSASRVGPGAGRAGRVGVDAGTGGHAAHASQQDARTLVLAATDPAQPYGAALPWPRRAAAAAPAPSSARVSASAGPAGRVAPSPARVPASAAPAGRAAPSPARVPASAAPAGRAAPSPARVPGALVVLVDADPVLYVERGGRALRWLTDEPPGGWRAALALEALAAHARAGLAPSRLALERVDGESVLGSPWEAALAAVGFRAGPRRLTLSA